jgi:hypothetical protein
MFDEENKLPFDAESKDELLDYKCKICGFEEQVPDFVAYESYGPDEFDEETGCPTIMCSECDGVMIEKKYFKV